MNSLDDPLDEQLRRQFQQVFDAYDVTPPTSLKDRIWRELPKAAFRRYVAYSLVLVGTLFPAGGRLFEQPSVQDSPNRQPASDFVGSVMVRRVDSPVTTRTVNNRTETVGLNDTKRTYLTTQEIGRRSKSLSEKPVRKRVVPVADQPITESIKTTLVRTSDKRTENFTVAQELVDRSCPEEDRVSSSQYTPVSGQESGGTNEVGKLRRPYLDVALSQQPPTVAEEMTPLPMVVSQLPTRWVPTGGLFSQINRRVACAPVSAPPDVRVTPHRVAPNWFVRVAVLSTYQQMTVVGKTGVHVQHVGSPSALSGQTWGYQLSGGIAWHQWDAYVSYGQIRRWAYYDLATDDFEVRPTGSTDYQVTRRVETRSENVPLPLLGAGLSKQYTLGRRQQYYARMGGQLTYVPSTQQTLGWAQASWGLNLPLGKANLVQVGPAVEYSLNRIWSTERQLIIHPYTVGISLTVRPQSMRPQSFLNR